MLVDIRYDAVKMPQTGTYIPVDLTIATMNQRYEKVLDAMRIWNLDILMVYGDREHGGNFAYLTGFEPRFEEAVLVLHQNGESWLMLGNENMKMASHSQIRSKAVHIPWFSLPNQPMDTETGLEGLFCQAGVCQDSRIGIAGWKLFTGNMGEGRQLFEVPDFIVQTVCRINGHGHTINASGLFLDPASGVRVCCNANEIAHYEAGAGMASARVLEALNSVEPGKTEMEIASLLNTWGQPTSVTTICAAGQRFTGGVVFPRNKPVQKGDAFSLTLGLRGGLSSRAAYVVNVREELPEPAQGYLEEAAMPYFQAAVTWYETLGIGVTGGEIYSAVEDVLPRARYHWILNPGHYTSDEEWLSSPVWNGSEIAVKSGMLFQMDIIPHIPGYGGVSAEDGVAVADKVLRDEIRFGYPEMWSRMVRRRKYMESQLGIHLKPEILPLSDICGYMRPYILNHGMGLKVVNPG